TAVSPCCYRDEKPLHSPRRAERRSTIFAISSAGQINETLLQGCNSPDHRGSAPRTGARWKLQVRRTANRSCTVGNRSSRRAVLSRGEGGLRSLECIHRSLRLPTWRRRHGAEWKKRDCFPRHRHYIRTVWRQHGPQYVRHHLHVAPQRSRRFRRVSKATRSELR